ncbi:cold shock domain-containing protein [Salmonella enterica]|uniref:cold shock domain-containing protein n=1 Tax=Salmonella enterica TaxID=28901 RepID=UPI0003BD4359|nr:cold shock domain-containing protein [Salmonella enterica]
MDGVVKWFSEEQGYGFITDKDNNDYYFHVTNVKGASLPKNGHTVYFDVEDHKAKNVSLNRKKENTYKILSSDYRKNIFDLYKDTLTCITIAILGIYLIKNDNQEIGWIIYITAGLLSVLAIVTTARTIETKFKNKDISKFGILVNFILCVFSIIILLGGLVKGMQEII